MITLIGRDKVKKFLFGIVLILTGCSVDGQDMILEKH